MDCISRRFIHITNTLLSITESLNLSSISNRGLAVVTSTTKSILMSEGFLILYNLQVIAANQLFHYNCIFSARWYHWRLTTPVFTPQFVKTKGHTTPEHLLIWQLGQWTAQTERIMTFTVHLSCITSVFPLTPAQKFNGLNADTLLKVLSSFWLLWLLLLCLKC